jgi:hypothetical protein
MTSPDDILDTRLAFKPGSGYFGWLLCPGAEIVPDEFDDNWANEGSEAMKTSDVMDLLWTYAESGAVVDRSLIAKVGRALTAICRECATPAPKSVSVQLAELATLREQLAAARAAAQHYFGMQTYFGLIESDHDWIEKCPWLEVWRENKTKAKEVTNG